MLRRVLGGSRYVVVLAVLGSFGAAVALILYGAAAVAVEIAGVLRGDGGSVDADGAKTLAVEFIELTDVFLLGTVLYIVALGLYELFIDADLPLPAWLRIETLDELKEQLIGVIVVLLAVTFLGKAVTWTEGIGILYLGAAVALVIAALAATRGRPAKRGAPREG